METLAPDPGRVKAPKEVWESLAAVSEKDAPWDRHRRTAEAVSGIYQGAGEGWIERLGVRVDACAPWLRFGQGVDLTTGALALHLENAYFCRVRFCNICQWRRSLMFKARMYQALPKLAEAYPAARWIFLTLTVKNCAVSDLRQTLGEMGKAWQRLNKRREFRDVFGWMKSVEVTRSQDGSAHPHFHALLLVKSTYYKPGHYVKTSQWVRAWREAARLDYDPICDVRAVRGKGRDGLHGAVAETLKYAVKPSDMVADGAWFLELTRQTRRTRAVASGGVLTDLLRDERNAGELLTPDPDAETPIIEIEGLPKLRFDWSPEAKHYRRKRRAA